MATIEGISLEKGIGRAVSMTKARGMGRIRAMIGRAIGGTTEAIGKDIATKAIGKDGKAMDGTRGKIKAKARESGAVVVVLNAAVAITTAILKR